MAASGTTPAAQIDGETGFEQLRQDSEAKVVRATVKSTTKRPDYRKIHALPLPLVIHPLPPLIPHNPLSLLHIAYVYLRQVIWSPISIPNPAYIGIFSPETQSIHVIDPISIQGLWNHGFFGKGSLSRSEPTWLEREKRRRGILATDTSEDYTRQRRNERRAMKLERARKEQEAIEQTLMIETGHVVLVPGSDHTQHVAAVGQEDLPLQKRIGAKDTGAFKTGAVANPTRVLNEEDFLFEEDLKNEEHLQLSLEEALFLAAALGVLDIKDGNSGKSMPLWSLLSRFMSIFTIQIPHVERIDSMAPDNPFIVSYVAYHYFRSLGWVVKAGNKFSVDFLLYLRGPVFAHAEFAVAVMPSYEHEYWTAKNKVIQKPWHWFHMVNRVQSSVRKTLIFCYVDIPPPSPELFAHDRDLSSLLKMYKVREFVLKRWSPNRNRG